jgi:unsaturated chondroitin disaccharide hydrolase
MLVTMLMLGFTMMYRYTKLPRYLDVAEQLMTYWSAHVPADGVPLWDFNAPPSQPYRYPHSRTGSHIRDTSAAAIVSSALLELDLARPGKGYGALAEKTLSSLATSYQASNSQAVLGQNAHDCGDIRCTVIETDYYLLEALLRLKARQQV